MAFESLDILPELAAKKGIKRLVVAVAQDEDVLLAVKKGMEQKLIIPVLIGNKSAIYVSAEKAGLDLSGGRGGRALGLL